MPARVCARMTSVRAGEHTAESLHSSLAGSVTRFSVAITGIFLAVLKIRKKNAKAAKAAKDHFSGEHGESGGRQSEPADEVQRVSKPAVLNRLPDGGQRCGRRRSGAGDVHPLAAGISRRHPIPEGIPDHDRQPALDQPSAVRPCAARTVCRPVAARADGHRSVQRSVERIVVG